MKNKKGFAGLEVLAGLVLAGILALNCQWVDESFCEWIDNICPKCWVEENIKTQPISFSWDW
jgi:hypothetical protein